MCNNQYLTGNRGNWPITRLSPSESYDDNVGVWTENDPVLIESNGLWQIKSGEYPYVALSDAPEPGVQIYIELKSTESDTVSFLSGCRGEIDSEDNYVIIQKLRLPLCFGYYGETCKWKTHFFKGREGGDDFFRFQSSCNKYLAGCQNQNAPNPTGVEDLPQNVLSITPASTVCPQDMTDDTCWKDTSWCKLHDTTVACVDCTSFCSGVCRCDVNA